MKKIFLNQLKADDRRAFTLTELLVVLGCVALLAMVSLSVAFTTSVNALRAQCISNLRQMGVGWSMYNSENNALMPCNWPGVCVDNVVGAGSASSPWRTHEIERVQPGTGIMSASDGITTSGLPIPQTMSGWWNLGKLWPNRFVSDPRIFYCPSGVPPLVSLNMTYAYYTAPNANPPQSWPTAAAQSGENEIRVAYDYYPQSRSLQLIGNFIGPVPATTLSGLDVTKCILSDQMMGYDSFAHRADGVVGANALFPDGHVKWDSAKANPSAFNLNNVGVGPYAWGLTSASGSIGQSTGGGIITFRYVKAHLPP